MSNLRAAPLKADQIDAAWALLSLTGNRRGNLDEWRTFAKESVDARNMQPSETGVMAIQCQRGYIYGLFSYIIENDPVHVRVLTVEPLAIARMAHSESPTDVMVRTADLLARDFRCRAIHLMVSADQSDGSGLQETGEQYGYRLTARRLCKELEVKASHSGNS